ncbi:MAG: aminopeptidase P family protein [candidate division WOR-3 bacterium]
MNERIEKLQAQFEEEHIDSFLVTSKENIFYLTGFRGDAGILFITPRKVLLITDYRFQGEVVNNLGEVEVCLTRKGYIEELAKHRIVRRKKRVGFESKNISYSLYWEMREKLNWLKFKGFDSFVENLRMIKDKEEIKKIKKASDILDKAFVETLNYIKEGLSEKEIAIELEYRVRKYGGEKISFETIVASGYRSSIPHGVATDKKIKKGDFITIDFGTAYEGYNADMTRTTFLGEPKEKDKEIYETVYKAQELAIQSIKENIRAKDLDKIVRDFLSKNGFGEYFLHSLGHGVGLEVHEPPYISKKGNYSLKEGMVFTIEPGIYLPQYQGVRIEDTIALKDSKPIYLTETKRELIIL